MPEKGYKLAQQSQTEESHTDSLLHEWETKIMVSFHHHHHKHAHYYYKCLVNVGKAELFHGDVIIGEHEQPVDMICVWHNHLFDVDDA